LVVGAASDFGRRAALELAQQGARLALNDLLPDGVEQLAAEIQAAGGDAAAYPDDLSKKLALQTALEHLLTDHERLDILVFASSVHPRDPILDMDEWDWRHALDLNLNAAFLVMQSVGRVMRAQGGGLMVFAIPESGDSAAAATGAAALEALAGAAALQLAEHGIRVHSLSKSNTQYALRKLSDYIELAFSLDKKEPSHG
jgi:NAD(P)-dependent dehydrogenase (short-subunit alcohol dehydrogenase family)